MNVARRDTVARSVGEPIGQQGAESGRRVKLSVVRRHRAAVLAIGIVVAASVAGIVNALETRERTLAGRQHVAQSIQFVLDVRRRLPADDPDVALAYNDLGVTLARAGRAAEGRPFVAEALAIRARTLDPFDPLVTTTMKDLASVTERSGDLQAAESLYVAVLSEEEETLGSEHPSVATTLNDLALLRKRMGRLANAEWLLSQALRIRLKTLSPQHLDVATSWLELGRLMKETGRIGRGNDYIRRAIAIRRAQLAQGHPLLREAEDAMR